MNCQTLTLFILLILDLGDTKRTTTLRRKQMTRSTIVKPTTNTATTSAFKSRSEFSVKKCSLLDFVILYDNVPSDFHMNENMVQKTFNSTLQLIVQFGATSAPLCYNIPIEAYNVEFAHASGTTNIGEIRATFLFKAVSGISLERLANSVTQCISVFLTMSMQNLIKQNIPKILVDGEYRKFHNISVTKERVCCGATPGTFRSGNDLCACIPGYRTDSQSPTGCSPCPADHYNSKSRAKKCSKCPGKKRTFGRTGATSKDSCYDRNPLRLPDFHEIKIPKEVKPSAVVLNFTIVGELALLNQAFKYSITNVTSKISKKTSSRRRDAYSQRSQCKRGGDEAPLNYFCIHSQEGVIKVTDAFQWVENEQFALTIEVKGENGILERSVISIISKDLCSDVSSLYNEAKQKCSPKPLHEYVADESTLVTHVVANRVKEIMKAQINESSNLLEPLYVHRLLINATSSSVAVEFMASERSTTVHFQTPFVVRPKGSEIMIQIGNYYSSLPLNLQGISIYLYGIPATTSCKDLVCLNSVYAWQKAAKSSKLCGNDPLYLKNWYEDCFVPPKIINPPKGKRVNKGESVTLTCQAQAPSDLALTISWYKDGQPLTEVTGRSFGIVSVQPVDQGSYRCNASTLYGSQMSPPALVVISDILTTMLSLSIEVKKKKPAPTSQEIIQAVKEYLDSSGKGWRFDVQFKETISKTSKSLNVKLYVYSTVSLGDIISYYEHLREWILKGVKQQKLKPLKINKKATRIQSAEYCLPEVTGKSKLKGEFEWPLTLIGNKTHITCPYGPDGTHAQRQCVGDFSSGASWSIEDDTSCNFKSKRTQAFDKLAKTKINKSNAKEIAEKTKSITQSAPAAEINSADVVFAANILEDILNTGEIDSTGQDLVDIIDSVLNANNSVLAESQKKNKTASKYVEIIETIAANLTIPPGQTSRDLLSPNLFIQAVFPNMDTFSKKGYNLASKSPASQVGNTLTEGMVVSSELPAEQIQTGISLPPAMVTRLQMISSSSTRLSLSIYQNPKFFQYVDDIEEAINDTVSRRWAVNTRVISCSVVGATMKNLKEPVVTTFEPLKQSAGYPVCAFWDFKANDGRGNWSTEGCKLATRSSGRLICHCNHMTNFAVLFSAQGPQSSAASDPHARALSIISYIGCALSLLGVLSTLITYAGFRSLRKSHAQHILMSLCVALALLLIVFMAGATRVGGMPGCRAVAVLLHYFVLTVVLWMGVEGYQMYLAFVKVLATYQKNFMLKISVFAWGVPAVIVAITAAVSISSYGGEYHCVLSGVPFYIAMFAPTLAVVIGNFVIFFYVMGCLVRETRNAIAADKNSDLWFRCRTAIAVMVLLGLTWVFGALAIGDAKRVFEYLFCIFNSLQGLFIFVFYCARQPEVRKQWRSLCGCKDDAVVSTKSTGASSAHGHRLRSDSDNSQAKRTKGRYMSPAYPPESISDC